MKHFTICELCRSTAARSRKIDNTPPHDVVRRLSLLVDNLLDPVREAWGNPILVNSGYRSAKLNRAVGGVDTSQHTRGQAADISTGNVHSNKLLFNKIVEMRQNRLIEFDQLIDESDYLWVHISYCRGSNRNQILHL